MKPTGFLTIAVMLSATSALAEIDMTAEPPGILSPSATQKLWDAYKTAGECFKHPTYGAGMSQSLSAIPKKVLAQQEWISPFAKVVGAKACVPPSVNRSAPKAIPIVRLNEEYGERQEAVDRAANWFRDAATFARLSGDQNTRDRLRAGIVAWAAGKSLAKGIHVSWGARPVDYQMMATIMSIVAATGEIASDLTVEEKAIVGPWLNSLVKQSAAGKWKDRSDNKAYMRTYMALLWGLMVGDEKPLQDAVFAFKLAIHDMRPDGVFQSTRSVAAWVFSTTPCRLVTS